MLVLAGWVLTALRFRRSLPLVSLGLFWFALCVLPVSNLLFPTGVLLAERTLFLPSFGLSLAVAGFLESVRPLRYPRILFALGLVLFVVTLLLNVIGLSVVRKYREQYD